MAWSRALLFGLFALATASPALAAGELCAEVEPVSMHAASPYLYQMSSPSPWAGARMLTAADVATADALVQAAAKGPVIVSGARLANRSFAGVRLSRVCFEDTDLSNTDWTGSIIEGVAFRNSTLAGAKLAKARLPGAVFWDTALDGVDASDADLSGATLWGGSFDRLSLHRATLRDFRMECGLTVGDHQCEWPGEKGVDARAADLTGARLNVYYLKYWRFDGAVLDRTVVQLQQVAEFRPAQVRGPVIVESSGYDTSARAEFSADEWRALLAAWREGQQPSFDCARATGRVEAAICGADDYRYRSLAGRDQWLARLYRGALARGETTAAEQRRWLARRNACAARADGELGGCLEAAYKARGEELRDRSTPPSWLVAGAEALYVDSDPLLADAFRPTELYRRLLPVIVASSSSTVYVRAIDRRTVAATGTAMGGNGHMCGLFGLAFKFRPESGWFGAETEDDHGNKSRRWVDVLQLTGDQADVAAHDEEMRISEFAGCGARANWDRMTRIDATPELLAVARKELETGRLP